MADLEATPKEIVVGFFKAGRDYDPLPALRSYGGPMLSVVTPINDEPFSLHNLGTGLPRTTFTGTGHWLHMDKPEEFNGILDGFRRRELLRIPSRDCLKNPYEYRKGLYETTKGVGKMHLWPFFGNQHLHS